MRKCSIFVGIGMGLQALLGQAGMAQQTPATAPNNAGAPPETEIYVADMQIGPGMVTVNNPRNITQHKGYDNQPYFLPSGDALLYTSEGPGARMDIWQLDLKTGVRTQLTDTPDNSEYSPKLMPDGSGFSVIYEQENRGGQEVRRYGFDDTKQSEVMLDLSPVGYHAWGHGTKYLATFALGNPPTLRLANRETGEIKIMHENIGRALYALPDGSGYTFTERLESGAFKVLHLDIESGAVTPLFDLPGGVGGNEHYALMVNEDAPLGISFISANGSKLYIRSVSQDAWLEIADMESQGINTITRLAVNAAGDKLAFVVR
ncbi:TolB family protein [Kordiimonas aquimaris]|uniref:TolB family protein n=1 Tax=Kordiimonas aquimaris TaxID=707591 RepID=UPI0021D34962|nr:hypothetical protein [Kordiimonas aquimaris]